MIECPYCQSVKVIKHGLRIRKNKNVVQRYHCNNCKHKFTTSADTAFYPQFVKERALRLFKKGMSYREIAQVMLKEHDIALSHVTIMSWQKAYEISTSK